MTTTAPQPNGIPPSSANTSSQTLANTPSQQPTSQSQTQPTITIQSNTQQQSLQPAPNSPTIQAPRPRDQRTIELLLTAQGVTGFEARVPLLLLDFAYRHTASILNDALHLSADPYTTHAGAKPSATAGGVATAPGTGGDATVSANAVRLAIQSRLAYQFRGGGGAAGGGAASKETLAAMATERNKTALPRVPPSEWGVRLPSERFVLSGVGWGLRDVMATTAESDSDEEEQDAGDAMEGVETNIEDVGGDGVEGGTMADMFPEDQLGEEDAEMMEE